ncbi:hypothetical protein AAV98_11525 [Bacillus sp. CHD6a]|nr:hypothetical protein AAV98_11525 [Bacillus sp. CHD6a]
MLIILFVLAMVISVGIGYLQTTVKYGNYEISDDTERIYIKKVSEAQTALLFPKRKYKQWW